MGARVEVRAVSARVRGADGITTSCGFLAPFQRELAAACGVPVAASARLTTGDTPRSMRAEQPYLLYPIGAVDVDPETIITFQGTLPVPVPGLSQAKRRRAEVTIDFFALDAREVLLEERAETIITLHVALHSVGHVEPGVRDSANLLVDRLTDIRSPHASCARAHHDLFLTNEPLATSFAEAAIDYLESLG